MNRKDYLAFGKPNFSDDEIANVARVLRSGWIGMGPETILFEEELAEFLNAPYVVTVNSCTSALFLSLLVNGIGPGDEVICPSLTWCSTANVIVYLGAKPVFCDVDPETLCLTPESVMEKVTPKTKAVLPVHMGGLAIEMGNFREALPEHIVIIEDAAHALGAKFSDGTPVGSSGNMTCFSFYANKNLSTGEGGAIALFDEKTADRLRSLRQNGMPVNAWKRFSQPESVLSPEMAELGYKMNYTDLQASIGRVQLRRQLEFYEIRLEIAKTYHENLKNISPEIKFQSKIIHPGHSRHLFLVQFPIEKSNFTRNELLLELRKRNIGASIHYPPLHRMSFYCDYCDQGRIALPQTEKIYSQIMTLPISASMNKKDAEYVIEQLKQCMT